MRPIWVVLALLTLFMVYAIVHREMQGPEPQRPPAPHREIPVSKEMRSYLKEGPTLSVLCFFVEMHL